MLHNIFIVLNGHGVAMKRQGRAEGMDKIIRLRGLQQRGQVSVQSRAMASVVYTQMTQFRQISNSREK